MPSAARRPTASRSLTSHSAVVPIDARGSYTVPSLSAPSMGFSTGGYPQPVRMQFQPAAMRPSTSSMMPGPGRELAVTKQGTRSRCLPPRSWYTGTPRLRATRSCRAMSIADSAAVRTRPPSKYWLR